MKLFVTLLALIAVAAAKPAEQYERLTGPNAVDGRIIGGTDAPEGVVPFQISIQVSNRHNW